MKDLSIAQSYFLCTVTPKGNLPATSTEAPVCLLAGALTDLLCANCIAIGADKKLAILSPLPADYSFLQPLYAYIESAAKPMKVEKLVYNYAFTFTNKRIKELMESIGKSLVDLGCARFEEGGLFGNHISVIPNADAVDRVIQQIRAELLEDGVISENIVGLVSLLERSYQIKKYFSAYEKDQLKARLKEIRSDSSNRLIRQMVDYIDEMVTMIIVISATT